MTKIKEVFDTIKAEDRKALINYIVVGDPDLKTTLEVMKVMVNEGVDIIELGIPFSDPMAEGVSCLLYTSPSPRDGTSSRMPSSA